MGFFGKKKKGSEPSRIFSERDIQEKLYGHYRPTQDRQGQVKPAGSSSQDSIPVKPKSTEPPAGDDLFSVPLPPSNVGPAHNVSRPEPKSTEISDAERTRILDWSAEEDRTVASLTSEQKDPAPKWQKPARQSKVVEPKKKPSIDFAKLAAKFFSTVGQVLYGLLGAVLGILVRLAKALDFRKPRVKRAGYWAAGIALLILLFVGIHYLNEQRESAMEARRARDASQAQQTPAASLPAEPAPAAAPAEEAPAPEPAPEQPAPSQPAEEASAPEQPSPAEPPAVQAEQPPPDVPGVTPTSHPYVIQVCTYVNQQDADRLSGRLKDQDFTSFVRKLSRSGGRVYYSVFIGRFENYRKAEQGLASFKANDISQPLQDAFVRKLTT